jgi:asparagine synthase (glutamine-hydrolysing)
MCGIAGIINNDPGEISATILKKMTDAIAHRGPDGEGFWISDDGRTGLGHRRLSIIDLSEQASQPMHYGNRYTIIFNGEIYNYIELREMLLKKGYSFSTSSDTEVIMALYDAEKENCLQMMDGMFSFVIYDDKEKKVFCARDRFGEKPFFYLYKKGEYFIFASEIKALIALRGKQSINNKMLYNYLSSGYLSNISDPSETFYRDILKLPQAHYLNLNTRDISINIKEYWKIDPNRIDLSISPTDAIENFRQLLSTSVNRRLRSDVNVGSSLSGGIDSSVIVCIIDDLLKKNKAEHSFASSAFKQKTFSARFPGFERDEGKYMQMVIDRTRVEPHFVYPSEETLLKDIDTVAYYQDEPFGGASILVQYEVMRLAQQNDVTVLLDGQGADEILAGYHWYYGIFFRELEKKNTAEFVREYNSYRELHKNNPVNKELKKDSDYYLRKYLPARVNTAKRTLTWLKQQKERTFNKDFFNTYSGDLFKTMPTFNNLNDSLYQSTMSGDLQVLLRYADRNSMAFSREVRLPFLSHEVVEFLFSLPPEFKIREGWTKWIMRKSFENILPAEISWRVDKIGYEPPQKKWMENNLFRERIFESRKKLVSNGVLNKKILKKDPKGNSATESGDKSWEHLMAGYLLR